MRKAWRGKRGGNGDGAKRGRARASADDGLAAGLLDLGLGRFREFRRGDLERAADLAVAKDFDRLLAAADRAAGREHLGRNLGALGVERREVPDVEDRDLGAVIVIVEAAVREFAVKPHLAALEAGADAAAGAGAPG